MSFDEFLYSKFLKYFSSLRKNDEELLQKQVELDELRPKLTLFARALTGSSIEIVPAEREGGCKGGYFFVPEKLSLFSNKEQNTALYIFRVLFMAIQWQMKLNLAAGEEQPVAISRKKAMDSWDSIGPYLSNDFPFAIELHDGLKQLLDEIAVNSKSPPDYSWLYGKWMPDNHVDSNQNQMNAPADLDSRHLLPKPITTLKSKAVEEVSTLTVDKKMQEDYVMTHNFEKVETAEEFNGVWRDFDGSDQLEDHQDALDELNMKFMVRSDEMVHSVYQAEFAENTSVAESKAIDETERCFEYDEWDYKKEIYKRSFCKVFSGRPGKSDPDYCARVMSENKSTLDTLRKMLADVSNKRRQVRYQTQGNNFDVDAVTDMFVEIKSGVTPTEKIYYSDRKNEKDIAILILLDNSLSTDSYAAGNRVIDVEKQVSLLFGEILNEYEIDFSIASFFSRTRNNTSYIALKEFDEPWFKAKGKVGAIEPNGYTRIGASLRHAGAMLNSRSAKNKWIILISDGKPNDYDRYEGKYGIHDVKQSLKELNVNNINVFALAIEAQARYYLPQMFGANHYQILTNPKEMLTALVKLFTKIRQL